MNPDNITFKKSGRNFDVHATFGDSDAVPVGLMMQAKTGVWSFFPRATEYRIEDPNSVKRMVMAAWQAFENAS